MKISGWMFTDAKVNSPCPKCGAIANADCHGPKGRKVWPPHGERIAAFQDMPDYDAEKYVAKVVSILDTIPGLRGIFKGTPV